MLAELTVVSPRMFSIGDCKPSDGAFRSAVSARPVSAVSTVKWMSIIVQSVGLERGTDAMHITVPHLRSSVQGAISTIAGRRAAPSRLRKTPPVALKASAVDDFADRRTGSGLLRLRRSSTDVIRGDDVVSIGSTDRGMGSRLACCIAGSGRLKPTPWRIHSAFVVAPVAWSPAVCWVGPARGSAIARGRI